MHNNRRKASLGLALALGSALALAGCSDLEKLRTEIVGIIDQATPPLPSSPSSSSSSSSSSQPKVATRQASGQPQNASLKQMEVEIIRDINSIRVRNKLNALEPTDRLNQVAREYSRRMAQGNFFSHYGPEGDSVADRVRKAGVFYLVVGENLARIGGSRRPAALAVEGWMKSPGHRENILRPVFVQTGVGAWQQGRTIYYTQVFLKGI